MKVIKAFVVFLAIGLLASAPAFAGGGKGPSTSVDASAKAKSVAINKTNVDIDIQNKMNQNQNQQQQQKQEQNQQQQQKQSSVNNNSVNSFSGGEVNFVTPGGGAYVEDHLQYNALSAAKIENGVSIYTRSSVSAFYSGLPEDELQILRREVQFVFYPSAVPSGVSATETRFLHGQKPEGVEGKDYFLVGEFEINAAPNDKCSLLVRGNAFKYKAAEEALKRSANAFTILSFGGDPEQRNGAWGLGISGGAGIGGSGLINAGASYGQSWSKKPTRPWAYGKFYYIPPRVEAPPVPARSCYSIEARVEELKSDRHSCKKWCFNNLRINKDLGEAYLDLLVCTGNIEYAHDAIEAFKRAERNYREGFDIKKHQTEADQMMNDSRHGVYILWSYAINKLEGDAAARQFATSHGLKTFATQGR